MTSVVGIARYRLTLREDGTFSGLEIWPDEGGYLALGPDVRSLDDLISDNELPR